MGDELQVRKFVHAKLVKLDRHYKYERDNWIDRC